MIFIADSLPFKVCIFLRSSGSKICKKVNYFYPDKGYCASQNTRYYGYRLHAVCSVSGVFQSIDLCPASIHNIHNLKDIKTQIKDCTLIVYNEHLSSQI